MRKLLVTSALPYANGPIHLGHLVEYLQTDIWVRFQKLVGNRAVYICADDTHGTAISIRAQKEGRSELDVIAEAAESHQRDFAGFGSNSTTSAAPTATPTARRVRRFGKPCATRISSSKRRSSSSTMSRKVSS